ncbi:Major vault protein [Exaiptasia diaphana]|nr:Major vault protein [Exaiptasia diaphana]
MSNIVRIQPLQYVHLKDLNTNVTVLEVGPKSMILQDNHVLEQGPLPFVVIPPGHYCMIQNPVKEPNQPGEQCNLNHGHREVRFHKEPFPLYPGEEIIGAKSLKDYKKGIKQLPVIGPNEALRLTAIIDHKDGDVDRFAGDMWQLEGPLTYYPTPFASFAENTQSFVTATIVRPGKALEITAKQDLIDKKGKKRVTGEVWLVREQGAYLPGIFEEITNVVEASTITQDFALHMLAKHTGIDALGKKRYAGDEWLVTIDDSDSYIPEVHETIIDTVKKTVLGKDEYCVVVDPVDSKGKNQLGLRELRKGVASFFLHPGESLEGGLIQKTHLLEADEALVLCSMDRFTDDSLQEKVERGPGDRWMILGPKAYIPPIEVKVRAVMGPQSYLLKAYEELWEKELPDNVELILQKGGGHGSEDIRKLAYFESSIDPKIASKGRDKTRVVVYRCPGNTAVQVYDYQKKTARVIFGPDLVVLGPHENFNVLSLSAGKPKRPNALRTICLMLGPDFITDLFEVETSDHARLAIKIAMNNFFDVDRTDPEAVQAIFSVPDFIGFVCKNIASRIRGKVAQVPFDEFHRYSVRIIKQAVFGEDDKGNIKTKLCFEANRLVITNVDIQSIEPIDRNMRESLSKSVQMAIEISTKSIELSAAHEAKRIEQEAEEARKTLFELQAVTAAVESSGQSKAEAQAKAERSLIEGESAIELAKLKAEANEIKLNAELESQRIKREGELAFKKRQNELKVERAKKLASIQVQKFSSMVNSIGPNTISNIALAGPESQAHMLQGLGIENVLITDGVTPLNLYQSSPGFICKPN